MPCQKVEVICQIMDQMAPPHLKEDYDNVGLLAGSMKTEVSGIYVALDVTRRVIERAQALDCQLIVTHHPILFRGRKNLREDDAEGALLCALIRSGMALFSAHTNFDNAPGGTGDCLAGALGLSDIEDGGDGMRMGLLPRAMNGAELVEYVERRLGGRPRLLRRSPDSPDRRTGDDRRPRRP